MSRLLSSWITNLIHMLSNQWHLALIVALFIQVTLWPIIDAGVNIFNVSGGKKTVELVKWVREQYPEFPIIASGGKTDESIEATIDAGANAITYTAYGMMEQYFHEKMELYRK